MPNAFTTCDGFPEVKTDTHQPASNLPSASPFRWLTDSRFGVWLTRLFWLLLILETYLWTSIGQLFRHGEIIAPVLFATSKATALVAASYGLAMLMPLWRKDQPPLRDSVGAITSALFLLWFGATFVHVISSLLVRLFNAGAAWMGAPGSNSWDMLDMLLRETGLLWFNEPTAAYLLLTNLAYGLIALLVLRLLAKRWPGNQIDRDGGLAALPHWSLLLGAYVVTATLHGLLMRVWV